MTSAIPRSNLQIKAVVDSAIAVGLLLLAFPAIIAISLSIMADALAAGEAPKIVFYERRLSGAIPFKMFKFRFVRLDELDRHFMDQPLESARRLERNKACLTRVGRVLGPFHLEQLPLLIHVAIGQMYLVGPRPYSLGEWETDPRVRIGARRNLKAGMLGPYQARWGAARGGTLANQADDEYWQFLRTASVIGTIKRDLHIMWVACSMGVNGAIGWRKM